MPRSVRQWILAPALLLGVALVASAEDRVTVRDRKADKVVDMLGDIADEKAAGIKLKVGSRTVDVSPSDVLRIQYNDLPKELKLDYSSIQSADERRDDEVALKDYEKLLPKLKSAPKSARQVEFRVAALKARVGSAEEGSAALRAFVAKHPNAWQTSVAGRLLARLNQSAGDYPAALEALDRVSALSGLPADVKIEVDLLTIDLLMSAKKPAEAQAKVAAAMQSAPAGDPVRERLEVYALLLDAKAKPEAKAQKLEDRLAKITDPVLKAITYNALGDCYRDAGKPRDAMWQYLWVDAVYNQDRGEHLKALDRLIKYFDETNDEKKKAYEDKAAKLK